MYQVAKLTIISLIITLFSSCNEKENSWEVISPNRDIKIKIEKSDTSNSGKLYYSVFIKNNNKFKEVIKPSQLGIEREDCDFIDNLQFLSAKTSTNNKISYKLVSGGRLNCQNSYSEININFANIQKDKLTLVFRAYNNGAAFQYFFPEDNKKQVRVINEITNFNLGNGNFWAHQYDTVTKWTPGYETYCEGPLAIGTDASDNKNGWAFPLLFETDNNWVLISESGFDGSYGASHLHNNCADGAYKIKFAETTEAMGFYENTSYGVLPWKTPWRFITIGKTLAAVTESHMVTDLAFLQNIKNSDWIKPGRSSWSWWSDNDSPRDYNKLVSFIDLSATMGWEYSLVDANWNIMNNGTLEQLAKYAESKKVGLLIWYNSGGKHNTVSEQPRDFMDDKLKRRKEFERISKIGIKGVKIDFFQSDKQEIIKQYIDILEDAADYKLVVNFHGCTLPRGWRRTYPNLLSMESNKGAECYGFDKTYPSMAPAHLTTYPFVRGVVGPTDYTPVGLTNNKYAHLTSYAFEIAQAIVIESGIIHYSDAIEGYTNLPDYAQDLLKEIPATWDETKYITGYPSKLAVIARRKGDKWYIGAINGENIAKTITCKLPFIKSKQISARLIADGETKNSIEEINISIKDNEFKINVLPFGGFAGVIE